MATGPKVIDLFCGVGGLSLGAARAGFNVIGAVDVDGKAMDAHGVNFRETRHFNADLSKISGHTLTSELEVDAREIDGIVGGPPCQGFSSMGLRNADDERNSLFVDFFRIVSDVKPAFFVAENVPGIIRPEYSTVLERAIDLVSRTYTVLEPISVSASAYGAPTIRKRVFFIGYLPDRIEEITPASFLPPPDVETVVVEDSLKGLWPKVSPAWQSESHGWRIARRHGKGYYADRLHDHVPDGIGDPNALRRLKDECRASGMLGTVHSKDVKKRYAALEHGERDPVSKSYRLNPKGFCPTLRAGTGPERGSFQAVRPIHPSQPRVITPREAARLQGFPDWFQFSPTKWHSFRQIGNSVSPIVAERLLSVFARAFSK